MRGLALPFLFFFRTNTVPIKQKLYVLVLYERFLEFVPLDKFGWTVVIGFLKLCTNNEILVQFALKAVFFV